MIKVEPCKGCGGVILVDDFMGLRVRCDPTTLDAQTAGQALVGGLTLYWVRTEGGRPHSFGSATVDVLKGLRSEVRPMVVAQHRCPAKAPGGRLTPSREAGRGNPQGPPPKAPQGLPVARTTPSLEPSPPARAESAASQGSDDGPTCETCGLKMAEGTYAAIELGELLVWAHHIEACGN